MDDVGIRTSVFPLLFREIAVKEQGKNSITYSSFEEKVLN